MVGAGGTAGTASEHRGGRTVSTGRGRSGRGGGESWTRSHPWEGRAQGRGGRAAPPTRRGGGRHDRDRRPGRRRGPRPRRRAATEPKRARPRRRSEAGLRRARPGWAGWSGASRSRVRRGGGCDGARRTPAPLLCRRRGGERDGEGRRTYLVNPEKTQLTPTLCRCRNALRAPTWWAAWRRL